MNNLYYLGLWTYRGEGEEKKKIELDQVTDGNLADPWTREEMHRLLDDMISEVGRYVDDVDG